MKSKGRFLTVILLAAVYTLGVGAAFHASLQAPALLAATGHEATFSLAKSILLGQPAPGESWSNGFHEPASLDLTSKAPSLWALARAAERLIGTAFAQYAHDSHGWPIQQRKADQLFPFHYFW